DVDLDGVMDVVVRAENGLLGIVNMAGVMRYSYPKRAFNFGNLGIVLADVTGDGAPEIVGVSGSTDRYLYAVDVLKNAMASGFPRRLQGTGALSLPTMADLNGDGRLDVVVASGSLEVLEPGAPYLPDGMFWPTLGGSPDRVARYVDPRSRPLSTRDW